MKPSAKDEYPGFVDLQVNGYGGIDFTAPGLTVEAVHEVTRMLCERGTIAYCPTLITASEELYRENLPVVAAAMRDPQWGASILGIHLEGPCFAMASSGAHPREHIQDPDYEAFRRWNGWAEGKIVLHTVAPELPGALGYIERLNKEGVCVSLGHHMADSDTITAAMKVGARICTHLGNGIPNQLNRHHNPILDQLTEDEMAVMFIPDGHHIPESLIKLITRMKSVEQCIAVSDSAPIAGLAPGAYTLWGKDVVLEASGLLQRADGDSLAGSSCCLLECMNVLARLGWFTEEALWTMGFVNPLALLGQTLPASLQTKRVEWDDGLYRLC
ncbi:N-acetylglucosamine-6-phosphate deacetylase [Kiritimatiellota bacterium B12222]|nr:N-acetylglucosamine-6-phosphate deacetylase [Kiritimatiellota bacterium B12222]